MPVSILSHLMNCVDVVCSSSGDADPLGVNTNVTFDEVGGLDDRTSISPLLMVYA